MDKEQIDMRLRGMFNDHHEHGLKEESEDAHVHGSDVQLSDILKPTTLIIGIIVLVVAVLTGWYIYVLKPALNDNESMIHFMPPAEQQAANEVAQPFAIAPNETLVPTPVPQSIAQPASAPSSPAPLSPEKPANQPDNTVTNTPSRPTHVAKTKPVIKSHHTHTNRKQAQNRKTQNAQHLPTLNEEQKCSPAQIAMQQCASYP